MTEVGGGVPALPGAAVPMLEVAPKKKKKKDREKEDDSSLGSKRGVETMFRTSYRTNMDLTSLADSKANIMISINGLIVSILIASIAPGIEKNPWLLVPTSLFLLGCLCSIVFAILAARPRVQTQTVTLEEARKKNTNILFFGNFSHLSKDEYVTAMRDVILSQNDMYEMMIEDVYGIGAVLQKKYRLLVRSYTAFLVALVLGVLSFIGVFGYAAFTQSDRTGPTTTIVTSPDAPLTPGLFPVPPVTP